MFNKFKIAAFCLVEAYLRDIELGLDLVNLPSKEWLLACLNGLNSEHRFV